MPLPSEKFSTMEPGVPHLDHVPRAFRGEIHRNFSALQRILEGSHCRPTLEFHLARPLARYLEPVEAPSLAPRVCRGTGRLGGYLDGETPDR